MNAVVDRALGVFLSNGYGVVGIELPTSWLSHVLEAEPGSVLFVGRLTVMRDRLRREHGLALNEAGASWRVELHAAGTVAS